MDYRAGLWQRKSLEAARTEERVYLKQVWPFLHTFIKGRKYIAFID